METKAPTPKELLMALANENPLVFICTAVVNGEGRFSYAYQNPGQALEMLFHLENQIKSEILKMTVKAPVPQNP